MKLTFPTQAEQALAEFREASRTTSLAVICKRRGATREQFWDRTEYVFDDDTTLVVRGRGRAHKVEALLP